MKKLLALVLALVMVMGLATISSNAAFPDAADVSLNEAVDVMSAVGVFKGNDAGNFDPKGNLDRQSAAKLIAYLDLGEKTAEALPAAQVFPDVPATNWAAKYIAYCKNAGYLTGDQNGNFLPTTELSGYSFGKMVLCVLGYDANIEGFTGSTWSINIAKLLKSNGITDGIDTAASLTLTREQAAQYCLNALKADMVEYDNKGTSITINGATIASGASQAKAIETTDVNYANKIKNEIGGGATKNIVQLGEKLYDGKLVFTSSSTPNTDAFGRPADKWTYKNNSIGTYASSVDFTYTGEVTGGTVYADIGKVTPTTVKVYVDGKELTDANDNNVITTTKGNIVSGNKKSVVRDDVPNDYTAAGVKTEVYYDSDTKTATFIVTNTYVATIAAYTAEKTNSSGDVSTKEGVTLSWLTQPGTMGYDDGDGETNRFVTKSFTKADQTDKTVVLYTAAWDTGANKYIVKSVAAAEKVENVAITNNSSTKVNGYSISKKAINATGLTMNSSTTYNLFLDAYGNVIYTSVYEGSANANWVYILGASADQTDFAEGVNYREVKYIDATGKTTVVKALEISAGVYPTVTSWYTFEESSDHTGYYKFSPVSTDTTVATHSKSGTTNTIVKTTPTLVDGLTANNKTTIIIQTDTNTYKVYEGLTNMPKYTSTNAMNVYGVVKDGSAALVYVAAYAAGAEDASSTSDDAVYVIELLNGSGYDPATKTTYYTYKAIQKGELVELKSKANDLTLGMVKLTTNSDGYITKDTAFDAGKYTSVSGAALNNKPIDYSNGILTVAGTGYAVADDMVVYFYDLSDEDFSVKVPSDLVGTTTASDNNYFAALYKSSDDHTIVALYFIGDLA